MKYLWVPAIGMMLAIAACTPPPQGGSGAAGTATTGDWKEGYGGDSVALEAVRIIERVCFRSRSFRQNMLKAALETDKDVSGAICDLLKTGELIVESVPQPVVNGIKKDAANYPYQKPRRLEIKNSYWSDLNTTDEAREELLLHELKPLIGLEDKDLVRSRRMKVMLDMNRGLMHEVTCDASTIEALFAGATLEGLRYVAKELGLIGCEAGLKVIEKHSNNGSFELVLKTEIQQSYAIGLFLGLVRVHDEGSSRRSQGLFLEAARRLPYMLTPFSKSMCSLYSEGMRDRKTCSGILNYMIGAGVAQKRVATSASLSIYDFDRVALVLISQMQASGDKRLISLFTGDDGNVNQELVKSAIRVHNWSQLRLLGIIQRELNSEEKASRVLLRGINWQVLLDEILLQAFESNDPRILQYKSCAPINAQEHAAAVLDGIYGALDCGGIQSI